MQTIATNVVNRRKRDMDVIAKMLDDANKQAKAPITKTNVFNYMNIGRQDPPRRTTFPLDPSFLISWVYLILKIILKCKREGL